MSTQPEWNTIWYTLIAIIALSLFYTLDSDYSITARTTAPNVILIVPDDAIWIYNTPTGEFTPNLQILNNQSIYYPNAYTTTPMCAKKPKFDPGKHRSIAADLHNQGYFTCFTVDMLL